MNQSTKFGATGLQERPVPRNARSARRGILRVTTWIAALCIGGTASMVSAKPPAKKVAVPPTSVTKGAKAAAPVPTPAAAAAAVFLVRVIEAQKGPAPKLDPRLVKMKREFGPFRGQFNQFTLIRDQTLRLGLNQAGKVGLPSGKEFGVKMLGFAGGKVRRVRYEVQMPRMRMKRSVAPGARTLDVIRNGAKLTIISTTVQ